MAIVGEGDGALETRARLFRFVSFFGPSGSAGRIFY